MHYDSALEIGGKIRDRETTSVAVTEMMLDRIGRIDPELKAYVTVTADEAMKAAARADRELADGNRRSALHGVPVAVKDLLDTAGIVTTCGMSIFKHRVPEHDATVVARLKTAGAVILGKLKLTEGAFARHHPSVEPPLNPWNPAFWTGVSSSGSGVATAAGLCYAAIGSDTGGSIRFPSAANGIVGLKPTWGRVSRAGGFPLAQTLDHFGPMTRSVADAAAVLQVIAGRDASDPTSSHRRVEDYLAEAPSSLEGLRIGIDRNYVSADVDPEVTEGVMEALDKLAELGCEIVEVTIAAEEIAAGWPVTCAVEAAWAHRDVFPDRRDEYGAIAELLDLGRSVTSAEYLEQEMVRRAFRAEADRVFGRVDLLLMPSMPFVRLPGENSADLTDAEENLGSTLKFTAPWDYSGHPTLSIPWRLSSLRQVPLSVQLVARDFDEAVLIGAGIALESAGGYAEQHPPV